MSSEMETPIGAARMKDADVRVDPNEPTISAEERSQNPLRNVWIVLGTLIVVTFVSIFFVFDFASIHWGEAISGTLANLNIIFFKANLTTITIPEALLEVLITMSMAFLTTVFSAIASFFLGLLAAQNLTNKKTSTIVKGLVAFIRSVPTVLWVLIYAIVAGLGSVAAVIGIGFHSVGYLTKMFSETFEEMDQGVIEALKATGASWWQVVFQAILPTTARSLVAWIFMRFEINYIVALGMGAAAGAGGIGYNLFMAGNFYYNMSEVGAITYLILISVLIFEFISVKIKKSLATN